MLEVGDRCRALIDHRGVDRQLVTEVVAAGNEALLARLEQLAPAEVDALNLGWRQRRDEDIWVSPLDWLSPTRCRFLCCPVAGVHDRTHPACVIQPLTWNGDQA
jgi:hypothetical protein